MCKELKAVAIRISNDPTTQILKNKT